MKHAVSGGMNGTIKNRVAIYFLFLSNHDGHKTEENKAIFLGRKQTVGNGIHYHITRVFCCCYLPPSIHCPWINLRDKQGIREYTKYKMAFAIVFGFKHSERKVPNSG